MSEQSQKIVTEVFFFALLISSAYLVWKLLLPFLGALALAGIIVTICYPLHARIKKKFPKLRQSLVAALSVIAVLIVVILPLTFISWLVLGEAVSIYTLYGNANSTAITDSIASVEKVIQVVVPGYSIEMTDVIQKTASFFVDHLVVIFAGTASTLFLFFIALIGMYYFFKDGKYFTDYLVRLSPLVDTEDVQILNRLAVAVRSVALGTITVAILQGILTAVGLTLFGFERAVLWGCLAAIGALIPGVGTTIVLGPAVLYLLFTGSYLFAGLLLLWGMLAVGLLDNTIGPILIGRGNNVHPFLILVSVLGGIVQFGPLGFILGPVILSLFLVMVELYHIHTKHFSGD